MQTVFPHSFIFTFKKCNVKSKTNMAPEFLVAPVEWILTRQVI